MADFTGTVNLNVNGILLNSIDVGIAEHVLNWGANMPLTSGTGASQANQVFVDTRTLTASSSENLDLAGALTNAFGSTITFTKIRALIIKADSGNTNDVVVGGHGSAAVASIFADTSDKIKVRPGGLFVLTAPDATGMAVTATTADMLTVANSAGSTSVSYTVIIIGTA
jgi:hypothetical protein